MVGGAGNGCLFQVKEIIVDQLGIEEEDVDQMLPLLMTWALILLISLSSLWHLKKNLI